MSFLGYRFRVLYARNSSTACHSTLQPLFLFFRGCRGRLCRLHCLMNAFALLLELHARIVLVLLECAGLLVHVYTTFQTVNEKQEEYDPAKDSNIKEQKDWRPAMDNPMLEAGQSKRIWNEVRAEGNFFVSFR